MKRFFRAENTGVKDMNGRDILEGDLLELHIKGVDLYVGNVFYNPTKAAFCVVYESNNADVELLVDAAPHSVYYGRYDEDETDISELNSPENLKARAENER